MPSFVVASLIPQTLPAPPDANMRYVSVMYIVEAANDQAAIDLVADWGVESAGTDYLAIPFNPKRATSS